MLKVLLRLKQLQTSSQQFLKISSCNVHTSLRMHVLQLSAGQCFHTQHLRQCAVLCSWQHWSSYYQSKQSRLQTSGLSVYLWHCRTCLQIVRSKCSVEAVCVGRLVWHAVEYSQCTELSIVIMSGTLDKVV